ncbi:hypothetical protein WICPIJ_003779 [Wickerhamomyces pijperi]|uniref:BRCT domain-containing protein n=1 Tax=Wickerhamomyces pijperi TaxID=599730 RepID=A0A9P8TNJ3_WICPI|nr:hypothetical protein WICPIJ_003779 [Wickerhamomyces pijperi]
MDHSSNKNLFENFKLLILESSHLNDGKISSMCAILKEYNVSFQIQDINKKITQEQFIKKEYTHIISNTSDFPLYKFAQESLIPVVTSEFIHRIKQLNRQPSIRPFSPNPQHVLKDVTVCVGGLPDTDKEAIYGAVRALGGSFSETLNKFVTHLISTDLDDDCCIVVNTIEEPRITIVVPNWIDDCIKLRRKLDVTPYLLVDDKLELAASLQHATEQVNKEQKSQRSEQPMKGLAVYLGSDLQLHESSSSINVKSWIQSAGAVITTDIRKANTYIGKYRDGLEYHTAMKNNLKVASCYWIYWMQEHQRYIDPYEKLLHHPWVRGGLPEMKEFSISSTNYTGDARQYVTKLIEALGAKFTTTLNKRNTHLIAASTSGKKYESACKWGNVQVINHLWLEETYADWSLKSTSHQRYSYYPHHFSMNELIGQTPLKIKVLRNFLDSGEIEQTTTTVNLIEDSQDEDIMDLVTSKEKLDILEKVRESQRLGTQAQTQTKISASSVGATDAATEVSDKKQKQKKKAATKITDTTNKENVTPPDQDGTVPVDSSIEANTNATAVKQNSINLPTATTKRALSPIKPNQDVVLEEIIELAGTASSGSTRVRAGRKAKNQASEKLHANMEELNIFEKQVKSNGVPLLPEEVAANKKRIKVEKMTKELKRARESGTEEELKANLTLEEKEILQEAEAKVKQPATKKAKKEATVSVSPEPTNVTASTTATTTKYNINAICTGWDSSFNKTETSLLANLGIHLFKDLKSNINTIASPKIMRTEKFLISLSYDIQYIIAPEFFKDVVTQYKSNPQDLDALPSLKDYSLSKLNSESVKENTTVGLDALLRRCQHNHANKSKIFQGLSFNITSKLPGGVDPISRILKAHGVKDIKVFKTVKELKTLANLKYTKGKKGERDTFVFLSNETAINTKLEQLLQSDGAQYDISGKIVEWDWVVGSIFNMELSKDHIVYELD